MRIHSSTTVSLDQTWNIVDDFYHFTSTKMAAIILLSSHRYNNPSSTIYSSRRISSIKHNKRWQNQSRWRMLNVKVILLPSVFRILQILPFYYVQYAKTGNSSWKDQHRSWIYINTEFFPLFFRSSLDLKHLFISASMDTLFVQW